jgi:hypothetical protein
MAVPNQSLEHKIEDAVSITGGMCGDDARFEKTMASYKENPKEGEVVFWILWRNLRGYFASFGGWIPFGPNASLQSQRQYFI